MARKEKHYRGILDADPDADPGAKIKSVHVTPLPLHHGEFFCDFDYQALFYHLFREVKSKDLFRLRYPVVGDNGRQRMTSFSKHPGKKKQRR